MSADGHGTKCRRNIAENINRLSRAHERYRQTTDRQTDRQTTDGRAIAYSEREREFTFAKNERLGRKVNFAPGKISSGGKNRRKRTYSIPAKETIKHRAKVDWPPLSDVAAPTTPTRETR